MRVEWDEAKNRWLMDHRSISFELVEQIIGSGDYQIRKHPDPLRHPNQVLLIFEFRGYTWVCPAVRGQRSLFLKTVYPSRKYHKARRER